MQAARCASCLGAAPCMRMSNLPRPGWSGAALWASSGGAAASSGLPLARAPAAPATAAAREGTHTHASGHWTLGEETHLEVEVKKSRFIVTAWPVQSGEQAMRLIADASDPSASHNCWAWRVGAAARSSDDGEPGGTAGRPILGAIEGDGLDGVAVLVTRFFGGIKLGSGGLVRAYGGSARDCLRAAPKVFVKRRARVTAVSPFASLGAVYAAAQRLGGAPDGEEGYTDAGDVRVTFLVDADVAGALVEAVSNATSGRVVPTVAAAGGDGGGGGDAGDGGGGEQT